MTEGLANAMKVIGAKKPLYLMQYPSGRWGFVGGVPSDLCYERGGMFPGLTSNAYDTREEALADAHGKGYNPLD